MTARVGLLVTCLADMFRPQIGFASVKLLEQAGCLRRVVLEGEAAQPVERHGDLPLVSG